MRAKVLETIERCASACEFVRAEDFHADFDAEGLGFTIRYLHDEAFTFRVGPHPGLRDRLLSIELPGDVEDRDERSRTWETLAPAITGWAQRVDEELKALPYIRKLGEVTARVDELEKLLAGIDPKRYATKDELEALRKRLDELERQAVATMEANADATEDVAAAVTKLHADVEALKQAAPNMPLRSVLRWAAVRFWGYIKSPNAAAEISGAVESVKALTSGITG